MDYPYTKNRPCLTLPFVKPPIAADRMDLTSINGELLQIKSTILEWCVRNGYLNRESDRGTPFFIIPKSSEDDLGSPENIVLRTNPEYTYQYLGDKDSTDPMSRKNGVVTLVTQITAPIGESGSSIVDGLWVLARSILIESTPYASSVFLKRVADGLVSFLPETEATKMFERILVIHEQHPMMLLMFAVQSIALSYGELPKD